MILLCPRCGAPLSTEFRGEWFTTREQCAECGVATHAPPAMLRTSDDEIQYGLDEWAASDRAALTAALADLDAPYRWEPGVVLVAPAAAESDVDRLLDDIEAAEANRAGGAEDDGDDNGDDGGEDAQAAMGDLFVAGDRLQHDPRDAELAADVGRAAIAVRESLPPYGVERGVWRRVQNLGAALADSSSRGTVDEDAIAAEAHALREFLREYV